MQSAYDTDFYAWTQHQAAALAVGHVSELDLARRAEEIESLGRRDRRALRSRLKVSVLHLLKWRSPPERRRKGRSWWRTIRTQRSEISLLLEDSPSLRRQVSAMMQADYQAVCMDAHGETDLPLTTLPQMCPWTSEQVLDETFWLTEDKRLPSGKRRQICIV